MVRNLHKLEFPSTQERARMAHFATHNPVHADCHDRLKFLDSIPDRIGSSAVHVDARGCSVVSLSYLADDKAC